MEHNTRNNPFVTLEGVSAKATIDVPNKDVPISPCSSKQSPRHMASHSHHWTIMSLLNANKKFKKIIIRKGVCTTIINSYRGFEPWMHPLETPKGANWATMTLGNCNEDYISFSIIIKPNENSLLVLSTTNNPLSQMFCFPSFYYIENHTKMSFFTTSTKQSKSMNPAKFEILKKIPSKNGRCWGWTNPRL